MTKRSLEIAVVSDVHLGTYGCHARELNRYLKSIDPKILILNGDIIDIWQFSKRYWPDSHMKVVKRIVKMISKGTKVYYLTGNHDEMLRRFTDFNLGNLTLLNKLVLHIDGKAMWFFHGDVFDITMKHSKWLAKLGGVGYDMLILLNRLINFISEKVFRQGKLSLSKRIKNSVKQAIKFIDDFEQTATDIAIDNGYDYVACGHIHQPAIRHFKNDNGQVVYLNSGDWVENLTSLEYNDGLWRIYRYHDDPAMTQEDKGRDEEEEVENDIVALHIEALYEDIVRHTRNG